MRAPRARSPSGAERRAPRPASCVQAALPGTASAPTPNHAGTHGGAEAGGVNRSMSRQRNSRQQDPKAAENRAVLCLFTAETEGQTAASAGLPRTAAPGGDLLSCLRTPDANCQRATPPPGRGPLAPRGGQGPWRRRCGPHAGRGEKGHFHRGSREAEGSPACRRELRAHPARPGPRPRVCLVRHLDPSDPRPSSGAPGGAARGAASVPGGPATSPPELTADQWLPGSGHRDRRRRRVLAGGQLAAGHPQHARHRSPAARPRNLQSPVQMQARSPFFESHLFSR